MIDDAELRLSSAPVVTLKSSQPRVSGRTSELHNPIVDGSGERRTVFSQYN